MFAAVSITPSLLPRPALLQGALAGIGFAFGYLLGVMIWAGVRALLWPKGQVPGFRRIWWIAYGTLWILAIMGLSGMALNWQNEVRRLVEMPPLDGVSVIHFLLAFVPLALGLVWAGKAVRSLFHLLQRRLSSLIAAVCSTVIVAALFGGVVALALGSVDRIYLERNGKPDPSVIEPASDFRSAGVASSVSWSTLGRHGAAFVGGGPTAQGISDLTGAPALDPIRVYAGLKSASTPQARAELVVSELKRTDAFERKVLVVATPTGSGWLEP